MIAHQKIIAAKTYGELRESLSHFDCRRCGLSDSRTHLVVDRGNPDARVLLVGEGPGAEEDKLGLAFVGRSGKLLDSMLREADIDPEKDVIIANVVKCRPPANRAPSRTEVESCFPYLTRQIELLRPKVIGLLGATAAKHLLRSHDTRSMSKIVGNFLEDESYPETDIMVLFHPAYILRNRTKRADMVAHLRRIQAKIRTPRPAKKSGTGTQ